MSAKSVLIIGDGLDHFYERLSKLQCLHNNPNITLVGDGIRVIGRRDIEVIKGKLSEYTRIDIFFHYYGHVTKKHTIRLDGQVKETKVLFNWIKELNSNKPLYIHLWSCYGGLANRYLKSLPINSILVTHVASNPMISQLGDHSLLHSITKYLEYSKVHPFQDILNDIAMGSLQTSSIAINLEKNKPLIINPSLKAVITDPGKVITDSANKLIKFYEGFCNEGTKSSTSDKDKLPFCKSKSLTLPMVTDKDQEQFKIGFLIFKFGSRDNKNIAEIEKLIQAGYDITNMVNADLNGFITPLSAACMSNLIRAVTLLLKYQVDVDKRLEDGSTAIYFAAQEGYVNVLELLLRNHANPNYYRSKDNTTPLFMAAQNGHVKAVEILLNFGADPNIADIDGVTPLGLICSKKYKNMPIAKLLLENNADPNIANKNGVTPLSQATQANLSDMVELLLSYNANPNQLRNDGTPPFLLAIQEGYLDIVLIYLRYKVDITKTTLDGDTALCIASQGSHQLIVKELLNELSTKQINQKCIQGTSALYRASQKNSYPIVEDLLKRKADPNIANDHGVTSLHIASMKGYEDIVNLLIYCGANPFIQDKVVAKTPYDLAVEGKHYGIQNTLKQAMHDYTNNADPSALVKRCWSEDFIKPLLYDEL